MTVTEYYAELTNIYCSRLNTDIKLVSTENVIEVPQYFLSTARAALACPYCLIYLTDKCTGCPALIKSVKCADEESTIKRLRLLMTPENTPLINADIEDLVTRYNEGISAGETNGLPIQI